MSKSMPSIQDILQMKPTELADWLQTTYIKPLPTPSSSQEFVKYNYLLGELANVYAFLSGLLVASKISVRDSKRRGLSKEEVDDCIDRRDTIDAYLGIIKMQYNAFSRMITVQKNADDEMRMMHY